MSSNKCKEEKKHMDKLNEFFNSKVFKSIEAALLVAVAFFLINYAGMPADFVSTVVVGLAGIVGVDGVATAISNFGKKKEEEKE